jgi:hypothetical protein
MKNTLHDDLALVALGEYGDLADNYDCYLVLEALFRKHKPHLMGRRIEPASLLRGLHAEILNEFPEAVDHIDGLGHPDGAIVLTAAVAQACSDLINELFFYIRDIERADNAWLQPDPEILQVLELCAS